MKFLNTPHIIFLNIFLSQVFLPSLVAQDGLFAPKKNVPILKAPQPKNLKEAKELFVKNYGDIASATSKSCLDQAIVLEKAIKAFIRKPSIETHRLAKISWINARFPYLQGEVFRIEQLMKTENAKIASRINGWPVVPEFIDYTKANALSGIIQNSQKYPSISKDTIMKLNRVDDSDQITLGYHVIEFLLWGEDNNASGSGGRNFKDYDESYNKFAERRSQFLMVCTELLINDLGNEVSEWKKGDKNNRLGLLQAMPSDDAVAIILKRISQVSSSISSSQIDSLFVEGSNFREQSTYSDATHFDFLHSVAGISNLFAGAYVGLDGKLKVLGLGLIGLAEQIASIEPDDLRSTMNNSMRSAQNFKGPFDALSSKDKSDQLYLDTKNSVTELSETLKLLTSTVNNIEKSLK